MQTLKRDRHCFATYKRDTLFCDAAVYAVYDVCEPHSNVSLRYKPHSDALLILRCKRHSNALLKICMTCTLQALPCPLHTTQPHTCQREAIAHEEHEDDHAQGHVALHEDGP